MKYILIIISFINTTLWKLAKLRGITPPPYITLISIWLSIWFFLVYFISFSFWLVKILDYMSVYDPTRPTSKNDTTWLHAWEYKQVLKQRKILCPWN